MQQRNIAWLMTILIIVAAATYVVIPGSHIDLTRLGIPIDQTFNVHQGLDLRGGLQVLLVADVPEGTTVDGSSMEVARQIVEQRVNGLGLTEPLVQTTQDNRRIVVELPGISDPQLAIDTIKQTGLLEFVYVGSQPPEAGTIVRTDCVDPSKVDCGNPTGAIIPTEVPTGIPSTPVTNGEPTAAAQGTAVGGTGEAAPTSSAATATPAATATVVPAEIPSGPIYHTVMAGVALRGSDTSVGRDQLGNWIINFALTNEGSRIFGDFTSQHVNEFIAIVLDKTVISAPRVDSPITGGSGQISGSFTQESANQLALQLRYGALPVPLKVDTSREVGPSLGQDSIRKSIVAGLIGMSIVALFMVLYYRLPGAVAVVALLTYAVVTFALFILIPVTLTLPGIAGFLLSTGSALDANILIFERLKEELRGGRPLRAVLAPAWQRAWPSIRDSNIATLIICAILYWFGSSFGASVVKGFAATLFIGVGISLFTALVVTRTLLTLVLEAFKPAERLKLWFGV